MINNLTIWASLMLFAMPIAVRSQEAIAGRVVKGNFAPAMPVQQRPALDLGNFSGADVPAGAEQVMLDINGVRFEGDPCPVPQAASDLRRAMAAPHLTVADLYAHVQAMEQELSQAGYVLTRVIVPPQRIEPGNPVRIKIINGRIDRIEASALPTPIRSPVSARLARLLGQPLLQRDDIERALLVAGDFGGLALRSTFAPGVSAGSTSLILDGAFSTFSGTTGIDRGASDSVGGWGATVSTSLNSPFGAGEQLYFTFQSDPRLGLGRDSGMRVLAAGAIIPLGTDGLTISPEIVGSRILPESRAGVPDSRNEMARASFRLNYPWIRQTNRTVITYATVDYISQRVRVSDFDFTLSSDSYATLRGVIEGQWLPSPQLTLLGSVKLSQGLGEARSVFSNVAGAPSTHQGAGAGFTKLDLTLGLTSQQDGVTASAFLRGQTSFGKPLFNSEQLALDGADALSSLPPGSYAVDEGATLRGELARPVFLRGINGIALSSYVFAGLAAGRIHNPTAVEAANIRAANVGLGMRMRLWRGARDKQALGLGVEFGRAWVDAVRMERASRLNLNLTWNF